MIQCIVFVVGPVLPMSTSHPSDVIHMMNETRPSPFIAVSSASVYYTDCNRGGLHENEAKVYE